MGESLGDRLRRQAQEASQVTRQKAQVILTREDELNAKRVIEAIPGLLDSASRDHRSFCEVYTLRKMGSDYDTNAYPHPSDLLDEVELHGLRPELFVRVARLVYDHLMTLEGVEIRLAPKSMSDPQLSGLSWVDAVFVVAW